MRDHTVTVDTSKKPTALSFADNFNVAVPFIDRHLAEGRSDKVAIRSTGGDTVTYGELANNVNRAGKALLGLGIKPGDRVLMMVMDCPEFHYIFWGAIKAGIVPVPLNTLLVAKDYKFMIEDSACTGVLYSTVFAGQVEPALAEAANKPRVALCVDAGTEPFQQKIADASDALDVAPARADSDCFWLYSSGTTGTPKGTIHRHRDMVVTSQHFGVDTLGMTEDDTVFSAAKLFFAYGLGNAMTFPLWVGATAVLFPARPMPDNTLDIIKNFKPSLYFGVPTLYAAQLQHMENNDFDISSVRYCISAGEALPADIFRRWKEKTGVTILDGIGSTEALHIFISNTPENSKAGTSGFIVPGYDAKIIDENDSPVPDGESGRLFIKGDSTARCYWNNPEKTASTMVGDWLSTGDTYIRDADGYFT
ncbi:MAG: benzoate-CoA ligase family protein, partial [Rhodospirillales bacterium]|nr:benzoate-CoA ligase family protein [Rhodospirillales bacterium]